MTQTVLVTGASGFIAAHVLNSFLEAGHHVRAAVRSEATAEKVRKTHAAFEKEISFAIVPDITTPGAFDEAVKGVDGVIHTASPFVINAGDFDKELFEPALKGTLSLLRAVKANAPEVKRVVITSSFAAILDPTKGLRPGYTYSEKDWNPMTVEDARQAGPTAAYLVSKLIAEKAAFDFVENEKPNFSVTTLTPPMVYGPVAHSVTSLTSMNTSSADIYRLINGSETEVPTTQFWGYIDVRDAAKAHLLAYETPEAANQRYLIVASAYSYQQFCDIIRAKFPALAESTPAGEPGQPLPDVYKIDNAKGRRELGLTYRTMEETVVDTVKSLMALEASLA